MSDLSDITAKLAALLAKTEAAGATEDEAMAAAAMAERIMRKHGITLDDVNRAATADTFAYRPTGSKAGQKLQSVDQFLGKSVARFCDCTSFWTNDELHFGGYRPDVEYAFFVRTVIARAMNAAWLDYLMNMKGYGAGRKAATDQAVFFAAMAGRLHERMKQIKVGSVMGSANPDASAALVVAKSAAVRAFLDEIGGVVTKNKARTYNGSNAARAAGRAAGDSVGFARPVGGAGGSPLAIGR